MAAKPPSLQGQPAPQKASRAPHRKTNQAHAHAPRHDDAAALRPSAREVDPAGLAGRRDGCHKPRHSTAGDIPPAGCPIAQDINLVLDLSEDLNRAMRQLRRKLDACEKCPLDDACGFRRAFQQRVDAMIKEVNAEWGLP
jgi:hypothetical protein